MFQFFITLYNINYKIICLYCHHISIIVYSMYIIVLMTLAACPHESTPSHDVASVGQPFPVSKGTFKPGSLAFCMSR